MIIFDKHKIAEHLFEDLLGEDWKSVRERCTHKKLSFNEKQLFQVFFKISVLKSFAIFTGTHLCFSLF